jgi:hypothetical protein
MRVRCAASLRRLLQRPDLDYTLRDCAWGPRHELDGLLHRCGFDDREPGHRESGGHEGACRYRHASIVVVSHLYGRARNAHNGSRLTQAHVMRVCLVTYGRVGAIVTFLVPVPDGHVFRHNRSPSSTSYRLLAGTDADRARNSSLRPKVRTPPQPLTSSRAGVRTRRSLQRGAAKADLVAVGVAVDHLAHTVPVRLLQGRLDSSGADALDPLIEVIYEHRV